MSKLLSILILTYNREKEVIYNIKLLDEYINKLNISDDVEIIVSDNCSTDNTFKEIEELSNGLNTKITLYRQGKNIGLEKNALFVLEKSDAKYVMYIGDDDYIQKEYLKSVVEKVKQQDLSCIVPGILAVTKNNEIIRGKNIGFPIREFDKGFKATLYMFKFGNQLSGVTLLRENTLESYVSNGGANLYPFMYFVGFNCMRGKSIHLTTYPVKVTEGAKKNWGYGYDGLLGDMFQNSKMLFPNSYLKRFLLEVSVLRKQPFRYVMYLKQGVLVALKSFLKIMSLKNFTIFGKLFLLFFYIFFILKAIVRRVILKVADLILNIIS
ncbi:MAG: glycosyltransferase family 2 protein [Methanosarcinaceae archaeon]